MKMGALVQQGAEREGECDCPYEEGVVSLDVEHQSQRLGYAQFVPGAASPLHRGGSLLQLRPCSIYENCRKKFNIDHELMK